MWVVLSETIVSATINAIVPAGIIWSLKVAPPQRVIGAGSVLPGLVVATVLPIFLMTILMTRALRWRVRTGRLKTGGGGGRDLGAATAFSLLGRASRYSLAGLLVLAPIALAAIHFLALLPMSREGFAIFNVSYGAAVAVALTPLVVFGALGRHA